MPSTTDVTHAVRLAAKRPVSLLQALAARESLIRRGVLVKLGAEVCVNLPRLEELCKDLSRGDQRLIRTFVAGAAIAACPATVFLLTSDESPRDLSGEVNDDVMEVFATLDGARDVAHREMRERSQDRAFGDGATWDKTETGGGPWPVITVWTWRVHYGGEPFTWTVRAVPIIA